MKFLVLRHLEVNRLSQEVIRVVMAQPKYSDKLKAGGQT